MSFTFLNCLHPAFKVFQLLYPLDVVVVLVGADWRRVALRRIVRPRCTGALFIFSRNPLVFSLPRERREKESPTALYSQLGMSQILVTRAVA